MGTIDLAHPGEAKGQRQPPSSAVRAEFWGEADAVRRHLTAEAPLAVLDYWERLRGPRLFPARAQFDPMAVRKYLPNIFMIDVLPDGEYRYRVVGTVISEFFGAGNAAGKTPQEVFGEAAEVALAPIRICAGERTPYMHKASAEWHYQDRNYVYYEVVVLPLGESDAAVDKVLCCAAFVGEDEAARR